MSEGELKPDVPPRFPHLNVKDRVIVETVESASVEKVNNLLGWSL